MDYFFHIFYRLQVTTATNTLSEEIDIWVILGKNLSINR